MTLADAQSRILAGAPFGDVFPSVAESEHGGLRAWFVTCPDVPHKPKPSASPVPAYQISRDQGYEGSECANCGAMKMRRNGACLVCDACGTTSGCS